MTLSLLHVEDASSDAILVRRAIARVSSDVAITHVASADDALEMLMGGLHVDLVLLDLNLPGMSGHEFLSKLRNDGRCAALPVLILTTSRNPVDVSKAYREHANAYYVKPSDFTSFVALAASLMEHWGRQAVLPKGD